LLSRTVSCNFTFLSEFQSIWMVTGQRVLRDVHPLHSSLLQACLHHPPLFLTSKFYSFIKKHFQNYQKNHFGSCIKLCCDSRFQRAFTACSCVFKVITLIGSNQGNYIENATACSKRTLKTTVATQL